MERSVVRAMIGSRCLSPRDVANGEPLLSAGQRWDRFIRIETGAVRMCITDRDGREFNKAFFLAGQHCFPVTPSMRSGPSRFSIHSIGTTRVLVGPVERVAGAMGDAAWRDLTRATMEALLDGKLEREHVLLTLDGAARYAWLKASKPQWLDVVPLRHLATYLGMTDVSLSRIRRADRNPDASMT